jgi:hypothetical protein
MSESNPSIFPTWQVSVAKLGNSAALFTAQGTPTGTYSVPVFCQLLPQLLRHFSAFQPALRLCGFACRAQMITESATFSCSGHVKPVDCGILSSNCFPLPVIRTGSVLRLEHSNEQHREQVLDRQAAEMKLLQPLHTSCATHLARCLTGSNPCRNLVEIVQARLYLAFKV